jgi:hypothetical protein
MDSPHSRNFQLSDTDTSAHRGSRVAADGETYGATLVLAGTVPEDWDGAAVDLPDAPAAFAISPSVARESLRVAWEAEADPGPPPADADDQDALDAYARRFALARFARRVAEGDPHAWIEALVSFWGRVPLPFDVACSVAVEDDLSVRIVLELPAPEALEHGVRASKGERHARYAELCCGVVLTLAADAFRILPAAADSVYVTAARAEVDPATGHPRRAILLRLATDRASLASLNLAAVTPSASFEHLGGALRRERGELVPLAYEED